MTRQGSYDSMEYGLVYNLTLLQMADDPTLKYLGIEKQGRDTLMDTTWRLHIAHDPNAVESAHSADRPENNYWWYYPRRSAHMSEKTGVLMAAYLLNLSHKNETSLKALKSRARFAENRHDIAMDCHDYQSRVEQLITPPLVQPHDKNMTVCLLTFVTRQRDRLRNDNSPLIQKLNRRRTGDPLPEEVRLLKAERVVDALQKQYETGKSLYIGGETVRRIEACTNEHFSKQRRFDILSYNCW
jgi:hypothetical protein